MNFLHTHRTLTRLFIIVLITAFALGSALRLRRAGVGGTVGSPGAAAKIDDFFYDLAYRTRRETDMQKSDVVLVAVDDASLASAGTPWPWPRTYWGDICTYLDRAGAKVIAFDVVFPNPSYYRDDDAFAAAFKTIKNPVIFGNMVGDDGDFGPFAPKAIENPNFGVVNLGNDKVYRRYLLDKNGQPSLAEMTVISAGMDPTKLTTNFPSTPEGFLLHYYGPHVRSDNKQTFPFIRAYNVWSAQKNGDGQKLGISPDMFKGKIVILCAIAVGAFDLKTSPLSDEYPGPEIQATAVENLLHNQKVHIAPAWLILLITLASALFVTTGIVLPRWASVKVLVPVLITAAVLTATVLAFRHDTIWWLSPVQPLVAIIIAAPLAFGFTYFAEDRQRRFMLKALSKVVSPAVAHQLAREPGRLALGTTRAEITVLFTDLANFTDLSEGMDVQALGKLVNRYLSEMSDQVFQNDGTLDKYIGDAVMCFWNAPLPQADHALRACRAALAMTRRERELQSEFAATLGKKRIFTRIGINTTSAAVGFVGSQHLFNFTALGDGINLASRMEGANKTYGSQIMLSETTALLVKDQYFLRKLDVLRVKGKKVPMGVYELLAERNAAVEPARARDLEERICGYEQALAAYQARQWDAAELKLLEIARQFEEDGPAQALLARVRDYKANPPANDWDGVYVSKTK